MDQQRHAGAGRLALSRRDVIAVLTAAALSTATAGAQEHRIIGVAVPGSQNDPVWRARYEILLGRLRELGWIEGRNFKVEWRFAEADFDALPRLVADLVSARVEVIVVNSAGLANIAHTVTRSVPIIVAGAGDLEGTSLVASLRHPGGNVTGTQTLNPDLMAKRIELLGQLVPDLHRLAVIEPITSTGIITEHYIQVIAQTAAALGVKIRRIPVRQPQEFYEAFRASAQAGEDAALVIANPLSVSNRQLVTQSAAENKKPTMYESRPFVASGGLASYGPDIVELYRDAADIVDKVLKGAEAADLPIIQSTKFELVINLKTAKALGLTVPESLLARADEVIE